MTPPAPVLFVLGVISWAVILVGSCAAVAAVYWLRERWWKR
ncbi:membrane protein [Arthrobacter phage Tuck]|uniref:Membrane protein n=2 Tax=Yangvirus TaxID=2733221 RepID=A0A9E8M9S2_9CAUD|nr:membrane protein [Arthrobacter phage Phives]QOP65194.1 membrane protein [Arthrobacter phage Phives]WAB10840.1 membrane protein [Arthrobacter phage Tuck]